MNYKLTDYFVLSSSCYITKGYNRSLIQDFNRNSSNLIANDYFDLIEYINRKKIDEVLNEIEEESKKYFFDFLNFMFENEYAIYVEDLTLFPEKSKEFHDEIVLIKDCIIEIDDSTDLQLLDTQIKQIDELNCENIQLWFKNEELTSDYLTLVLNKINQYNFLCTEICIGDPKYINRDNCLFVIDHYPSISKIFLFNSKEAYIYNYMSEHKGFHSMLMGQIIYVNHPLDANNCGVIRYDNLSFGDENQFIVNKLFNGCLYKKIVVDTKGNLKNCPYIPVSYPTKNIKELILKPEFRNYWYIKKDEIEVCKDCEFRNNCTDCRAFTTEPNNRYSKPSKCNYDPYTNEWK